MDSFEEKACLCALGRIFGFEPRKGLALIERMGCASALFALDKDGVSEILGSCCRQRFQIRQAAVFDAARELETLEKAGVEFVGWGQEGYPLMLTECPDPPIGIYIKSATRPKDLWTRPKNIAVIGTRDISPYGKEWCAKVVGGLADTQQNPLIVSGLALGTDICAHRTAIERGLPTIAVIPSLMSNDESGQPAQAPCIRRPAGPHSRLRTYHRLPARHPSPSGELPQKEPHHCRPEPCDSACRIQDKGRRHDDR